MSRQNSEIFRKIVTIQAGADGKLGLTKHRSTVESSTNTQKNITTIFPKGRSIALEGGKNLAAVNSAKAAGNFGFGFNHAQVTLGLIVVKRSVWVGDKSEMLGFIFFQSSQELHVSTVVIRRLIFQKFFVTLL
jgi:hypothetical protein